MSLCSGRVIRKQDARNSPPSCTNSTHQRTFPPRPYYAGDPILRGRSLATYIRRSFEIDAAYSACALAPPPVCTIVYCCPTKKRVRSHGRIFPRRRDTYGAIHHTPVLQERDERLFCYLASPWYTFSRFRLAAAPTPPLARVRRIKKIYSHSSTMRYHAMSCHAMPRCGSKNGSNENASSASRENGRDREISDAAAAAAADADVETGRDLLDTQHIH